MRNYAHTQLVDLGNYDMRPVKERPAWLAKQDENKFFNGAIKNKNMNDFVFVGGDIIKGIGMTIVNDAREFSKESQEKIFNMRSPSEVNELMNSLLRPQIAFPSMLALKKEEFEVKKPAAGNLSLSSKPKIASTTLPGGQKHFYI